MLRPEDCIPGTLVECIRSSGVTALVRGRIYEVESYIEWAPGSIPGEDEDGDGVDIVGVYEACQTTGERICYGLGRFRRLPDERLSVFRKMLAPAPKQTEPV